MSKKYFCDHCDTELHERSKLSITPHDGKSGIDIHQGDHNSGEFFIHRNNFSRFDFCDLDCMVQCLSGGKFKVIKKLITK
jgi:hypothetical protein